MVALKNEGEHFFACQKSLFDKLVDGEASSPATATPSISFR